MKYTGRHQTDFNVQGYPHPSSQYSGRWPVSLGFGRSVASDTEVPNMFASPV